MTLRLNGSTSGYTEIDAPAVAGSNTLVLPTGNGSAHQILKNGATAGSLEYGPAFPSGNGTNGQYLQTNGSGTLSWASVTGLPAQVLTLGTSVASTSGTSIDFTSIPSTVKRVTVMFNGVSTNGGSLVQVQLGSGSFATSGYNSGSGSTNATTNGSSSTTGMLFSNYTSSGDTRSGHLIATNIAGNTWVSGHFSFLPGTAFGTVGAGSVTLSGTLDRIRITTVNGTDAFDAGTINILYEG